MRTILDFKLSADDFDYVDAECSRPECVLAFDDGTILVSDNRAALLRIRPDGGQELIGSMQGRPNGFAVMSDGSLYMANIEHGAFYRVAQDGQEELILDSFNNQRLGAANFAYADPHHADRLWLSVSTRFVPRNQATEEEIPDGYILLRDRRGIRCVASGFTFTNEMRIDQSGTYLYVAETASARISRLSIGLDGALTDRTTFGFAPLVPGAKIDGIAFDAMGNLWVTELTRNALLAVTPEGQLHTVFEDPSGLVLLKPSSIAFAGPDLQTVLVGSLESTRLARFRSPIPGLAMRHWEMSW